MHNHARVPVGVLGASGYVGRELLRLLAGHPGASVAFATAETAAGEVVEGQRLVKTEDAKLTRAELVFSGLPHGGSGRSRNEGGAGGPRGGGLAPPLRPTPA